MTRYYLLPISVTLVCLPLLTIGRAQSPGGLFQRLDRNQDGKLTRDELPAERRALFNRIDSNRDGVITAEEDRAFLQRRVGQRFGQVPMLRVPETVTAILDIPYAATDNPRQQLDLYLPKEISPQKPLPVVVFIHGGGWQNGDRRGGYRTLAPLVESGDYIGVSLGYRLSGEVVWPAQIHDCKAAIRWLKANAEKYHLDPERIGVTGTSAGGHLVAMLGTTGGVEALEGKLGDQLNQSSRVACVVDQYGPTDLLSMGGLHNQPTSPESKLIGGAVQDHPAQAQGASPAEYVTADDAPTLLIHGDKDPVVPFGQSELLHKRLKEVGVETVLVPVVGGGHGNFASEEVPRRLRAFFDKHLRGKQTVISAEPILLGKHGG